MHVFGAFELEIQPGTPDNPASVRVALLRYVRGEDGRLYVAPECTSFEEVEGRSTPCKTNWTRIPRQIPARVPSRLKRKPAFEGRLRPSRFLGHTPSKKPDVCRRPPQRACRKQESFALGFETSA